jgi:arsenite methyltransferase
MPRAAFLPIIVRELLSERTLPREPEPDLVMTDEAQVKAYSHAGRIDGVMSAAYLFHSAHASTVIHGADRTLDLGCGPGTQLAQIASLNPDTQFVGIDLSTTMLESARAHIAKLGLSNVRLAQGDITDLRAFPDHSLDAVTSTMALHHLPTRDHIDACFREISRVLKPGGALYLTDFARLKSLKSVIAFAYMNAEHQPHIFSLDYERSLRAAFLREDFIDCVETFLPPGVRTYSTWIVPLLVIVRTAPRRLPEHVVRKLRDLRDSLPRTYRRDLDDLRLFFNFGGLPGDPFESS